MNRGSEAGDWRSFNLQLGAFGRLKRIENRVEVGAPDVLYLLPRIPVSSGVMVTGWVELKHLAKFPSRPTSPVVVPKLKREQVLWQEDWAKAGGRVCTLLRVGLDYWGFLDAPLVRALFERRLIQGDLRGIPRWTMFPDKEKWLRWLTE